MTNWFTHKNDLDVYQSLASETAVYPTLGHPIVYPALGLAGEAGEVAEKVKKLCRDDGMMLSKVWIESIKKELGDVLWYVSEVARQAGLTLSEVANANIEKLSKRQEQGCLNGSGDDRELEADNGAYGPETARKVCPSCGFEIGHASWCGEGL